MEITEHAHPSEAKPLKIEAVDEPSHGGANHSYVVSAPNGDAIVGIPFQKGSVPDAGVNGVTHEALITIVLHRLEGFQAGGLGCAENNSAIGHLRAALNWLHARTSARVQRGVEGKEQP